MNFEEKMRRLGVEIEIRNARPELWWLIEVDQVCFCDACCEVNRCKQCTRWERRVTVVERGPRDHPLGRYAYVSEFHDEGCPALKVRPKSAREHSPIRRRDLEPTRDLVGPRNRFLPIRAAKCLELDTSEWPDSQWLYRAFEKDGELLYVGITGNVAGRMRTHRRSSPWWTRCHYVEIAEYETRAEAAGAERRAIRRELPLFNIAD